MRLQVPGANSFRVSAISIRVPGNTLFGVGIAKLRVPGNNIFTAFASLSASANPSSVSGSGYGAGMVVISTDETTVTVIGGVGPYTHAWSNPDPTWTAINPTSATTAFRIKVMAGNESSAVFTDTITDGDGNIVTVTVNTSAVNNYDI